MLGAVAHPQDPRLDLPEKGRDRTAGDRLVYQDRMVEDLFWAYPGQRGEEDLSPVCPEGCWANLPGRVRKYFVMNEGFYQKITIQISAPPVDGAMG